MSVSVQNKKPLFPDILWSRPETKQGAGKLLIIGGGGGSINIVSGSYSDAQDAGAGSIQLLLPNSLAKLSKLLPEAHFGPCTPSGSFAKNALSDFLDLAERADGVLIAGDLGKNSETSLLLENFLTKYTGPVFIAQDALQSFSVSLQAIGSHAQTTIELHFKELRQLVIELKLETPLLAETSQQQLAEILRQISKKLPTRIVYTAAGSSEVWFAQSNTLLLSKTPRHNFTTETVWAIQQPEKAMEAMITATIDKA